MWIIMSKVLPYLVFPLSLTLEFMLFGWILRHLGIKKTGKFFQLTGIAVLLVASSPMAAGLLTKRLEHWYTPVVAAEAPHADAIVLLGGALSLPLSPRVSEELTEASDRVLYAARLYRAGKARRILVTGGNVFEQQEGVKSESWYISRLLQEWGVPAPAILIEDSSQNTRENATESKKILDRENIETILLVTSASHMPRALATFRGEGINAIPAPVDYIVVNYAQPMVLDILPSAGALFLTTRTIREYLGIFVYGMRGWLKAESERRYEF